MTPFDEGRAAAERGESFRDHCPYSFDKSGLTVSQFNEQMRPKMDAWFDGWKSWLDEHGLGFNFEPKGDGHSKGRPRKQPRYEFGIRPHPPG